jgi:hypothetical protein
MDFIKSRNNKSTRYNSVFRNRLSGRERESQDKGLFLNIIFNHFYANHQNRYFIIRFIG